MIAGRLSSTRQVKALTTMCNEYARVLGNAIHEKKPIVLERESTVSLVLRLRGGMFHKSSGRDGFENLDEEKAKKESQIKEHEKQRNEE